MEKSCGVVLFNETKVLLLQHPDGTKVGHWDFPKGHVEIGESEIQTAVRELGEETGITDINILPDFSHTISYSLIKKGQKIDKKVIFFVALTNETNVVLSHEHQAFAWLDLDTALNRLTYENAKKTLVLSFDFYQKK
ncbi:MAG TPA: bis(5'-nucleosyl)-tetraphosphatase [Candidatus Poseidoniia archaeon]|jgi:8-oxo-dGTP pyrophosphatase MutT (NUDIX family)|nr:bis(5'-nucleosyl)-tetraphosphatase [Candidatus Poseidoniia archaeon]|tara:strand:- start:2122 stop:2532 length:411 start_codon:yes stop_codon:yes gene_type:complete